MARSAKLTSIDAVREMAVAMINFGDEAIQALDELDINVRRALDWIEQDRKKFWAHEIRRGWERYNEARTEYEKAKTYRKVGDDSPSCRQERKIMEQAKRRVQTAEEKERVLPRWEHSIKHGVQELHGMQMQLANWLRNDLPRSISMLEHMAAALQRYAAVQGGSSTPQSAATDGSRVETNDATPEDDQDLKTNENEESDHEDMGSPHPGGQTASGDEGPEGHQGENQ
jgi:hypothetical protein